jgi:hypothetical protein
LQNARRQLAVEHVGAGDPDRRTRQALVHLAARRTDGWAGQLRSVEDFQHLPARPARHLRKHGQRQQVRIVKPGSSFDLVDQTPDLLIRLIQAQRVGQGQWRRLVIEVHLAQGIITDTTEVGDFEQLLIENASVE